MNWERLFFSVVCGLFVGACLMFLGYLAACAGAERWLTFREWWRVRK